MSARAFALCAIAVCAIVPAHAEPNVRIDNAWVRPANAGQPATPLYADVTSDAPLTLVGAASDASKGAALFASELAGERAIAKPVRSLDVSAGATFRLVPRGAFVELQRITRLIRTGDPVPFVLDFKTADGKPLRVSGSAVVRGLMPRPTEHADGASDAATMPSSDGVPMPGTGN